MHKGGKDEFDGPVWPHLDGHIWPHPVTIVCPISRSNWFLPPRREWSLATPVGRRRLGVTDAGVAKTAPPGARVSVLLPPFHRAPESERFRAGLDDVCPIGDSV